MGSITSLKCVLTQEHLNAVCAKYFVPEEVISTAQFRCYHCMKEDQTGYSWNVQPDSLIMQLRFSDELDVHFFWVDAVCGSAMPRLSVSRFPEEFLCWVGISVITFGNKVDLSPPLSMMDGGGVGLFAEKGFENAFYPVLLISPHATRLLCLVPSGELWPGVEKEFAGDAVLSDGVDQRVARNFARINENRVVPTLPYLTSLLLLPEQLHLGGGSDAPKGGLGMLVSDAGVSVRIERIWLGCKLPEREVHKLELSSADLRLKLETYEGVLAQLEEFQDNLMGPLRTRLAEIDADFTRCCMRFQESFHPHLLNVIAGRRWLLTHGVKLLLVKCLNSNEYMEALGHAFGRAIEKGMQEGLAAGIEHGQAGRCLADLEAYIPSAEDDFNSAIRDLRDLNFPLLQELSNKKDASTWEIMDLLRLDDIVAETLGMADLQPDADQLMVPIHHKQDGIIIGSQALSVALNVCRGRVEKMERNLIERLPFLKDVFASIEDPLSAEALIEPSAEVPATNVLSTVVIAPPPDPSISVEDYDNPDPAVVVPENAASGLEREEQTDASAGGGLTFSQLDDEAMDAVL
ncbi:hypothetical protein Tco_0084011 [Tanacetum coccineum]